MSSRWIPVYALYGALTAWMWCAPSAAEAQAPHLSISPTNSGLLALDISNAPTGSTYYIEQLDEWTTNAWREVHAFEGSTGQAEWTTPATNGTGFFRVVSDPYHEKVGQNAPLDTPGFHNVSGTAHIVNNRTVELRNFNFDGGGIVVQAVLSPDASFNTYTPISEDLFGTAYTNATLRLEVPDSVNLDETAYISIWCVAAGVSFGDGMFQ